MSDQNAQSDTPQQEEFPASQAENQTAPVIDSVEEMPAAVPSDGAYNTLVLGAPAQLMDSNTNKMVDVDPTGFPLVHEGEELEESPRPDQA